MASPPVKLTFPDACVDIHALGDDLIYVRFTGVYTDEVLVKMMEALEPLVLAMPGPHVRVMDASAVPATCFRLSAAGTEKASEWGQQIHAKRPGSTSYLVGTTAVSYGMGRMYAMRSNLESKGVTVLQSLEDLPPEIRAKLPV
jgi:hypothetical protein